MNKLTQNCACRAGTIAEYFAPFQG